MPNFVGWWNETCGEVATLVSDLPSPKTISIVAEAFDSKLVQLEKVLNKARIATAKKRRQDDVNIIFRDLKKESPKPCTTLQLQQEHIDCRATQLDLANICANVHMDL